MAGIPPHLFQEASKGDLKLFQNFWGWYPPPMKRKPGKCEDALIFGKVPRPIIRLLGKG